MSTAVVDRPAPPDVRRGSLLGTGRLLRFALRRDRVRLPVWVGAIAAGLWVTAAGFPGLYPDQAARDARATIIQSPAAVALAGPKIGVDDYTFGAMLTNELLALTSVVVALMCIFTVVRHTRADEEAGRTELLLATPIGRFAPLAAALLVTLLALLTLLLLVALGLGSLGLESVDWPGSWLYACALVSVGLVFAGVAAVAAQVSEHGRTASSLAGLVLGIAYGLRAVGDVTDTFLSWLSPVGWAQRTYAYVDDRWWPLALSLITTVVLLVVTVQLASRRDLGAGLRQPRPGPSGAGPSLAGPTGLALRLQRVALVAWLLAMLAFGLVYGSLLGEVESFAGDTETVENVLSQFSGQLLDAFMSLLVMLLAMTASVFAVIAALRAQSEERTSHAEALLAAPVSRSRWLAGHVAVAAVGGVAVLLAGAIGVGISGSVAVSDVGVLGKMVTGALVQVAPLLLVVSVAVALYGLAPGLTGLIWVVVGYGLFVGTFGGLLQLPDWAMNASPYAMVPLLPGEAFSPWPVVAMLAVAAALDAAGLWGLRRRDLRYG